MVSYIGFWPRTITAVAWCALWCTLQSVAAHAQTAEAARLAALKVRAMDADYQADLEGLRKVRDELAGLRTSTRTGHLVLIRYWEGFASWRLAVNGVNRGEPGPLVEEHLHRALVAFDSAMALEPEFADALAASASIHAWLKTFHLDDPAALSRLGRRSSELLARAKALEPDNPRVLWVEAGILFNTPAQFGGDQARGLALFRAALDASRRESRRDLEPDWGEPEALMSLAWSHLNKAEPDVAEAKRLAEQALDLRPDWFYVGEILLPAIKRRLGS